MHRRTSISSAVAASNMGPHVSAQFQVILTFTEAYTRLGEEPGILGTYEAQYPHHELTDAQARTAAELGYFLSHAHPGLDALDTFKNPWGMMFHAPALDSWAPTSAFVPVGGGGPSLIKEALKSAQKNRKDLHSVMVTSIPSFPEGITGVGLSAEIRAYIYCYITSLYAPTQHSVALPSSQRASEFASRLSGASSMILRQTIPIMSALASVSPTSSSVCWTSPPVMPFLYFLLELLRVKPGALKGLPDRPEAILGVLYNVHVSAGIPLLQPNLGNLDRPPLPLSIPVSWLLVAKASRSKGSIINALLKTDNKRSHASWLFFTSTSDLDAYTDSLTSFGIGREWIVERSQFRQAMKAALPLVSPRCYPEQVPVVCQTLLDFFM